MKHAQIRRTESTLRRDRCLHQWLHSHETSHVFVRCSCTKLMQEDVRRAVPQTITGRKIATCVARRRRRRTWCRRSSGVSRSREQSRIHSPEIWSPTHPCKCISTDGDFEGLLFYSLCAYKRWDEDVLFAMHVRNFVSLEELSLSILIGSKKEGRR
jgi:hypothetical protein